MLCNLKNLHYVINNKIFHLLGSCLYSSIMITNYLRLVNFPLFSFKHALCIFTQQKQNEIQYKITVILCYLLYDLNKETFKLISTSLGLELLLNVSFEISPFYNNLLSPFNN